MGHGVVHQQCDRREGPPGARPRARIPRACRLPHEPAAHHRDQYASQLLMPVSRRTFLRCAGALPLAALGAPELFGASKPRVAVVGAGAFGGWTALHLRNHGCDVVLLDEWGPGNMLSSSGGKTRVIRAIYGADRIYSEMVKRSFELWETLDKSTTDKLYVPTGILWMHRGDDAYVRAALPILHDLGFPVDRLALDDAAKRYPQVDFRGVKSVWFEHRGGALFSRRACRAVQDAFEKAGGRYRTATVTPGRIANGMPGIDGRWFKIADDTRGETIDPTTMKRVASPQGIERARAFLAERFPQLAKAPLLSAEVCQYENSPDGNLIVDRHPGAKNVWLLGGGSGHGFKLAPAVGELAAQAVLSGREVPKMFRLDRLPALLKPKTQFERGSLPADHDVCVV